MNVKVAASLLDKTNFDPEQGTAGVERALMVIQAPEPAVQYISLVPVAIQTAAQVVSTFNWHCSQQLSRPEIHQNSEVATSSIIGFPHNDFFPLKRLMQLIRCRHVARALVRDRGVRKECAQ